MAPYHAHLRWLHTTHTAVRESRDFTYLAFCPQLVMAAWSLGMPTRLWSREERTSARYPPSSWQVLTHVGKWQG